MLSQNWRKEPHTSCNLGVRATVRGNTKSGKLIQRDLDVIHTNKKLDAQPMVVQELAYSLPNYFNESSWSAPNALGRYALN